MADLLFEITELLKKAPKGDVFNPWFDQDKENDYYTNAPEIRRHQMRAFLSERVSPQGIKALLLGEAIGYQGGHFSGIPMVSERILLGHQSKKGILPEHVFQTLMPSATSIRGIEANGFNEPTATIVWEYLVNAGVNTYDYAIWNSFPWHPYNPKKGILSNRTPTKSELEAGHEVLKNILKLLKPKKIIAVGKKASEQLEIFGLEHFCVRHPANGGATEFRKQMSDLVLTLNRE
ncbi:MAG: uracil-DNA glycosylase [Candidatus Riflebacteria bacterium]|nr:uracil-DNA glycosylase [Candidatus Riflebacteria bacterium]